MKSLSLLVLFDSSFVIKTDFVNYELDRSLLLLSDSLSLSLDLMDIITFNGDIADSRYSVTVYDTV